MKLRRSFFSCIVLAAMLFTAGICNAENEPDIYTFEAETTAYEINGVAKEAVTQTEGDVTYIIYKNEEKGANDNITFEIDVPENGRYEIAVTIRKVTTDSAYYSWCVDGNAAQYKMYFAGNRFQNQWLSIDLGQHDLTAGKHTVGMFGSSKLREIQIDKIEVTKCNNQTFFILNEYKKGNVKVCDLSTPIATAVENDVYSTVVYEAKNVGEAVSLNFTTETSGLFDISFVIKSGGTTAGTFDFYVDGNMVKEAVNLKKYGKGDWTKIDFGQAELPAGEHEFKFVCNTTPGRILFSEMKLTAVREGFGLFAPEMRDENGVITSITQPGNIVARAYVYNYEDDKDLLLVQMYYDKVGSMSVLKDIIITPYTIMSGECDMIESEISVTDLSENVKVSAFVCDYTDGILYVDSEMSEISCQLQDN